MKINFLDFYNQFPNEIRDMVDSLGISSFEEILAMGILMGMDINKLQKSFEDGSTASGSVKFEDLLADDRSNIISKLLMGVDDNESHMDEYSDQDGDDNPFAFPENCFIGQECQELHLRIKLLDAPVPVWREIKIPSNTSLALFSFVINDVMGWENEHLHEFNINGATYKHTACIKMDEDMGFGYGKTKILNTKDYPISEFFKEKKDRMAYEYDFGDGWRHEIWLKGIRKYNTNEKLMFVACKGSGACPPEDCGGVWGYGELLEINAKKRKTAEEKERLDWYCIDKDFDPEYFDIDEAQDILDALWDIAYDKLHC